MLVILAAAVSALLLIGVAGATRGDNNQPPCTHGASSIGPLIISDGKVVGGDQTPHTEACLP